MAAILYQSGNAAATMCQVADAAKRMIGDIERRTVLRISAAKPGGEAQ